MGFTLLDSLFGGMDIVAGENETSTEHTKDIAEDTATGSAFSFLSEPESNSSSFNFMSGDAGDSKDLSSFSFLNNTVDGNSDFTSPTEVNAHLV